MRSQQGFTLIEMMITVAIVALLAAVVYPAYTDQVVKTRRAEAKTTLVQVRQDLERCFTRYAAYNNANCTTANRLGAGIDTDGDFYVVTGQVNAASYSLTATPQGVQATKDTDCAKFEIDETGAKKVTGSSTVDKCW